MIASGRIALPRPRYKVEQVIEDRKHFYSITHSDGRIERFPGVTGILHVINRPALIPWATKIGVESMAGALRMHKNTAVKITEGWIEAITKEAITMPETIKDNAADIGIRVHAWLDAYIQGKELPITKDMRCAIDAFKAWIKQSKLSIVAGDTKVASVMHQYGGALDFLAIDEDEQWVLGDFKTSSSGAYKEYALQTSAYLVGLSETYGIDCIRIVIVRFSKKEPIKFEINEVHDIGRAFSAFLSARSLQESLKGDFFKPSCQKPKNP